MSGPLPERILITKRNQNSQSDFEFFVDLVFESLPKYCQQCGIIKHDMQFCRRREETNINEYVQLPLQWNAASTDHRRRHTQPVARTNNTARNKGISQTVNQNKEADTTNFKKQRPGSTTARGIGDRQTVSFKHYKPAESVRNEKNDKPWSIGRDNDREKKLDRIASEIMDA